MNDAVSKLFSEQMGKLEDEYNELLDIEEKEFNPNKAGLFEGTFVWEDQFDSPTFIFQEELI